MIKAFTQLLGRLVFCTIIFGLIFLIGYEAMCRLDEVLKAGGY